MSQYEHAEEAAGAIRRRVDRVPAVAVVLGSGLGGFAATLRGAVTVPYNELPHWPVPGAAGHAGTLVIGEARGHAVMVLSGRCHAYEGLDLREVTFAIRVLGRLGVRELLLTNAAGAVNPRFTPGSLMVIDDHINLIGGNPLVGQNDERFGPRFPELSAVYSARLRTIAHEAGLARGVPLEHGVYAAVLGPSYETPAEIRYLRAIGADAVGMSTVPEAIVARHMRLDVLGLSCITNMAAGVGPDPLDHREVLETADRAQAFFITLLEDVIHRL